MGMREYPNYGYVVPLSKFYQFFTDMEVAIIKAKLADGLDDYELQEYIERIWPPTFPKFVQIFIPGDEATVDDTIMFRQGIYVIFAEDDLFEKKPKQFTKMLENVDAKPELTAWSVFG